MSLIEEIRKTAAGAAILDDWLGAGAHPVPQDLAEQRAVICVGCDQNQPGSWWDRTRSIIAQAIRRQLELRKELRLSVVNEEALGSCLVCGCNNKLAVHTPIEHIKSHTASEMLSKFPAWCWKRKEIC